MNILAIDTGSRGGIILLNPEGEPIAARPLPTAKSGKYWETLILFVKSAQKCGDLEAVVEKVWGLPGQAGGSTIAKNFGVVLGILRAHGIEAIEVVPQTWQRPFVPQREKRVRGDESDQGRKDRLNRDREKRKAELVRQAAIHYGRMVDHSGVADALLIGRWRWMVCTGQIEAPKGKPKKKKGRPKK